MSQLITEVPKGERYAIYNELSHMTPYYLSNENGGIEDINIRHEARFHINNMKLMSLYFDKILIPIENIISFANKRNMLVIQEVVCSHSFKQMLDLNIISLCGWGAVDSKSMVSNGIRYALKEYGNLKDDKYIIKLEKIALSRPILTREASKFDLGHDLFLLNELSLLDDASDRASLESVTDYVKQFYGSYKFIGSLEFYRWIDGGALSGKLSASLYKAYYRAWQEYCYQNYAPAIAVNSERVGYSYGEINIGNKKDPIYVKAMLYSPIIFLRFLEWQLGIKSVRKLVSLSPESIQSIRNGDGAWSRFKKKYHSCIEASSEIFWLGNEIQYLRRDLNKENTDFIIQELFKNSMHRLNEPAFADVINALSAPLSWAASLFNPAAILVYLLKFIFKRVTTGPFSKDAVPFYKKINYLVQKEPVMLTI